MSVPAGKPCSVDGCSGFSELVAQKRNREDAVENNLDENRTVCEKHFRTEDFVPKPELTANLTNFSRENSENQKEIDSFQQLKNQYMSFLEWGSKHKNKFTEELLLNVHAYFLKRSVNQPISRSRVLIDWHQIENPYGNNVLNYRSIKNLGLKSVDIQNSLNKLVVVKLNGGGLGTSMGYNCSKSVIKVKNDFTFLDLAIQQIISLNQKFNVSVPLVLMNSFHTDNDAKKVIDKYKQFRVDIHTFNQSVFPFISEETLEPIAKSFNTEVNLENWYPTGHGDFYECFRASGLLKKFLDSGHEYCFISNIDNLGATVDLSILKFLMGSLTDWPEFVMEVTNKTKADVKGGTLVQYENRLRLLDVSQVPKTHLQEFKSDKTFSLFNTNNLWIKLGAVERVLSEGSLNLDMIANHKTLENNLKTIQFERSIGSGMTSFNHSRGIIVPRSRFLSVKKTSDLFLVMSDLYTEHNGKLSIHPYRMFPTIPLVKLDDKHFSKIKDLLSRFENIPSIHELDHLTVSGDVTFGRNVSLKGTVIIIAKDGERIDIPSGTTFENKIVSGNLRILDH